MRLTLCESHQYILIIVMQNLTQADVTIIKSGLMILNKLKDAAIQMATI